MSSVGIDASTDLQTLLTTNWNSTNTDSITPTISDHLQKNWEDISFGTTDFLYITYDTEAVTTTLHADAFFHKVAISIEVIVPGYGQTTDRTHFNNVMKEIARIVKANPRQTGYAYTLYQGSKARYNRDKNMFIGNVDVEVFKVLTS